MDQKEEGNSSQQWWIKPLEIFLRISVWIALPIVGALFLGKYLDAKWGTAPWFFLGLTGVAFILSCVGIVRESQKYLKEIEEENGNNNDNSNNK